MCHRTARSLIDVSHPSILQTCVSDIQTQSDRLSGCTQCPAPRPATPPASRSAPRPRLATCPAPRPIPCPAPRPAPLWPVLEVLSEIVSPTQTRMRRIGCIFVKLLKLGSTQSSNIPFRGTPRAPSSPRALAIQRTR